MSGIIGRPENKSGVITGSGKKGYGTYMSGSWAMFNGNKDQGDNWYFIASAVGTGNWPNYNLNFDEDSADVGTYPTAPNYGIINNMYRRFRGLNANQIMFMTGDHSRWFTAGLAQIQKSTTSATSFLFINNSGNLGHATHGNVLHRANGEDPWIDANITHTGNHIFWGEDNNNNYIGNIKNTYGGIFVFVK